MVWPWPSGARITDFRYEGRIGAHVPYNHARAGFSRVNRELRPKRPRGLKKMEFISVMVKFTDGPLVKFAALKLGLRIISRGRWK